MRQALFLMIILPEWMLLQVMFLSESRILSGQADQYQISEYREMDGAGERCWAFYESTLYVPDLYFDLRHCGAVAGVASGY